MHTPYRRGILLCWLALNLSLPVHAQSQEGRLGASSGKILGDDGNIWSLLQQSRYPLRIGILPVIHLNTKPTEANLQADLDAYLQTALPELQHIQSQPRILSNQRLLALADEVRLDLVIQPKLIALEDRHWLMLSVYSGPAGEVVQNTSHTLAQADPQTITDVIQSTLKDLAPSVPIHDWQQPDVQLGELHLRTRPEGMQVHLNQRAVGLTPLFIRGLEQGEHLVQVQENIAYQVKRIQVISSPPGVQVEINGKNRGLTPLDFPAELLGSGTYQLRFKSADTFKAEIRVQTQPEQVPVQLNNLPVQRSPVSFQELTQTEHTLTLLPYSAVKVRKPFSIAPQEAQTLEINAYKSARLNIETAISGAQLYLDGELAGDTPYTSHLAQGQYSLKISKTRYRTQERLIELQPGESHDLFYTLTPRSTDTSIFLTPTGELSGQFNLGIKYLGFGNLEPDSLAHLYGLEVDYGWPSLYQFADTFDIGLGISGFAFSLHSQNIWRRFQGLGTKLQFLRESDSIPISAAIGTYLSLDPEHNAWVGYLSLSRNFGDFALHLGLQTHGFNLNFGYTGWDHLRLGAIVYADSFLRLLAEDNESSSTFYGLQLGYSF
ncbi:MAG: PEGA domain-containing protein [Candidatus Sericytochromatia bacterium]|nr:PEGA domain-containing protein [Candidatus Sericytochromatia bacterium]